jgi:Mg-chelatase subunit ChlD
VDEPISLVVVLDASASMAAKLKEALKAFTELVNTSNAHEDCSLILIGDEPRVAVHFDEPASTILEAVDGLQPGRRHGVVGRYLSGHEGTEEFVL